MDFRSCFLFFLSIKYLNYVTAGWWMVLSFNFMLWSSFIYGLWFYMGFKKYYDFVLINLLVFSCVTLAIPAPKSKTPLHCNLIFGSNMYASFIWEWDVILIKPWVLDSVRVTTNHSSRKVSVHISEFNSLTKCSL